MTFQESVQSKIDALNTKKQVMKEYINLKFLEEDWHAVSDAANDLREIEQDIKTAKEILALVESD